jgi:beta-aspartyl-peptidase (threonine type)
MKPEEAARYTEALTAVLVAGERLLAQGAPALEVAVEAVRQLEECELFNAGKGAVYTAIETHELDACVMDGRFLRAGAVAGLSRTRNPVLAALAVLEHSEHMMFFGAAADAFAAQHGLEQVTPDWFGTPARLQQLRAAQQASGGAVLDHDGAALTAPGAPLDEGRKFGTVGAVALDAQGHLAAATSTGGMTNKQPGRIGDTPIVGAGCYANDATVAVSCTGTGEVFMRTLAAHEISTLMRHRGMPLAEAAAQVVHELLPLFKGQGGLVAIAANGDIALPFNTEGMYRGAVRLGLPPQVAIYREAP